MKPNDRMSSPYNLTKIECRRIGDTLLYCPEKVLESGSLALMYSQRLKVNLYIVLAFVFGFLSHYNGVRAADFSS